MTELADTLRFALKDRIRDVEVGPAHVSLKLLGEFQKDVADFLRGSGKEVALDDVSVAIEEGSLVLAVAGLMAAPGLWADVDRLQTSTTLDWIDPRRAAVLERWQHNVRNSPYRSYQMTNGGFSLLVDISTDFRNQQEAVWVKVEKYLLGKILDLGGKSKPNIHLELDNGAILIVSATEKLLTGEQRNHVYQRTLLHVMAEENILTGELRNYNLLSFETYQPVFDEAAFEQMIRKGTQAWADVPDANAWLEDLRGNVG